MMLVSIIMQVEAYTIILCTALPKTVVVSIQLFFGMMDIIIHY